MRAIGVQIDMPEQGGGGGGFRVEHHRERAVAFQATDPTELEIVRDMLVTQVDHVADHRIGEGTGYVSLLGSVDVTQLPEPAQIAFAATFPPRS